MESDETRIYNAAHLMVASLAGSLAHVTCKVFSVTELLCSSFSFVYLELEARSFYLIFFFLITINWCSLFARSHYVVQYQVS
jgi:hypothetical protein